MHLKDYDFEKPALDVSGKAQDTSNGQDALEVYDYPGEYVAPGVGKGAAKVRLEEAVQAARTLEGEGVCPRLTPGYRFEVEDDGTHAGEYVVVEVVHSGQQPETPGSREALGNLYRNSFKCMPAKVPFRPRRTTPVPHIAGLQTATVVGPGGRGNPHGRARAHQGAVPLGPGGPAGRQGLVLGARGAGVGRPGVGRAVPAANRARRWWCASWRATRTGR